MQVFVVVQDWKQDDGGGHTHWEQRNLGVFSSRELADAYIKKCPAEGIAYGAWEFTLDKEYEYD